MLEAHAHHHLKQLLQDEISIWPHNLTLSRLIGRSLRRRDNSLFQLPIGSQEFWWPGLLIPLCLESSDAVLVLSSRQRNRLIQFELPRLKKNGFTFSVWEGIQPPPNGTVWLLNYCDFLKVSENNYLYSKQIIIPEAELFCSRLRNEMALEINYSDWENLRRAHPSLNKIILEIYQFLTRKLCKYSFSEETQVTIDNSDLSTLKDFLGILGPSPNPWPLLIKALNQDWASWGQLNHKTLQWKWHLQPLEPLLNIQKLYKESSVLMLAGSCRNDLLISDLEATNCSLNVSIQLGGLINQEPIQLFVPGLQPLPNTEIFADHLLDQCRRLILGRKGLTIVLLDDVQARKILTSQLAAEFGSRVVHETTAPEINGVVCSSCTWWLNHHQQLPDPEQLIFAILPFASLESPLIAARVKALKSKGRDWFRELLLPDVLSVIPQAVDPIRRNQGRIAILDGRVRSRSWGDLILQTLEPWIPLERLLPN
tara:strand:+ start:201 stop:1646 length:1446 start_codon:yes stop_codon:yes gene_type:complete